ncbi:hypothetical protein FACS1894158_11630 [Betaproteobacteria bacterium]|nr:hypothetical protein FACS1894158_11630 [Betaproteobacteria bacterium]
MVRLNRYELSQVCLRLSSGKNIRAEFVQKAGRYPVYGGNGLRGYTDRANFEGDCAIIGRQGAFCGNVRYFSGSAYMTEHAVVVCANEKSDTKYLAYLLSTMNLGRLSGQSAQPGLSVQTLAKQVVDLPSLPKQVEIGGTLRALDEKIANNSKINHHLEQMTQTVFDRLFIEESAGEPLGMLSDIAEINPLRSISKGEEALYIEMANLPTSGSFPVNWTTRPFSGGMKFQNGDTIMARITPCLENGKTAYINFLGEDEVAFGSTEYIVIAPKQGYCSEMFYFLARNQDFVSYAVKNMNGSSGRQRVSGDSIGAYELRIPPMENVDEFAQTAQPVMETIAHNALESRRLAILRDTLLPRLMSGELSVADLGDAK